MTFQHGGHGCAGVAGVLGAFGIHLPDKHEVQDRINEHHERVTQHVQEHRDAVHDRLNDVRDSVQSHFGGSGGSVRDSITHHTGEVLGLPGDPLQLVFGNPALASSEHFSLAAIPVGGGVTMSIVALLAVICMVLIMASMLVKTVVVRCSG